MEETEPGAFRYKRGPSATPKVVLAFSLMDGSQKKELQVLAAAERPCRKPAELKPPRTLPALRSTRRRTPRTGKRPSGPHGGQTHEEAFGMLAAMAERATRQGRARRVASFEALPGGSPSSSLGKDVFGACAD